MHRVATIFILQLLTIFQFLKANAFNGFTCANYEADTVFRLSKTETEVVIQWDLKRGLKSLPLYEGIVNIDVLPLIQDQIKDLKELDTSVVKMKRPLNQCKFTEPSPHKRSKTLVDSKNAKLNSVNLKQFNLSEDYEKQVNCDGKVEFLEPRTTHIESYTLMTSWLEEKFADWSYRAFKVRMGLDTPDQHYLITFIFDPAKCVFY